ncbi:hypothetical protein CsSME_00044670 [Camellia sinensis var. sinensis]
MWGLDIVGPFSTAPGNRKFFLAATDYFTNIPPSKWPGRSIKQSRLRWIEEKAGESKRQVGLGAPSCFMGLPYHTSAVNWRNTFFLGLWHGSSNPTGSLPSHY